MTSPGGSVATIVPENLQRALHASPHPLKLSQLSKLLKQKSGAALKPLADTAIQSGLIFAWSRDLYWDRNPRTLARERLLTISSQEILTADPLNKKATDPSIQLNLKIVREVRNELVQAKLLREVDPPKGSKSKAKLIVNAEHPEPYLESEIDRLLRTFGIERPLSRIRALLDTTTTAPPQTAHDVRAAAEMIFQAMNRIAFAPGTTVTFYRLRQQPELAGIPKAIFDQAALLLQQQRRALLAIHDHAPRLPENERDVLVTDGKGAYYVSIYSL
jgi:hypothetical protein